MAYNTKEVLRDVDGNPISQYYDPLSDSYKPVEGSGGGNKVNVENNQGLSLIPILDKLSQLTGTVIDEETRKSNEITRKSNESSRVSVESDRVSAENTRVGNENTRKSNETARQTSESSRVTEEGERVTAESNRVSAESIRVSSENTRKSNEDTRKSQESNRESNEDLRIALYDDLQSKLSSGFFKGEKGDTGNGLEYTWNGTQLGIRVEGTSEYVYVDLKGEKGDTGEIENLTSAHVTDALGFTPLSEDSLPSNLETTSGSQTKADAAEQNAKDYADVGLADKVDKVTGKGLSTNDYTTTEKNKLNGIQAGAQANTVTSVAGKTGAVTVSKSDVGLSNVENLSAASIRSGTTKANVGLSNVDNVKQMPISGGVLENYREKLTTVTASGGSINLSLGNVFVHTPSGNRTYSITNAVSGQAHSFTLIINMGSVARTLTFPSSVKWQGGDIPDMSTRNKTYVLTFVTVNGGSNWLGMFGGEF